MNSKILMNSTILMIYTPVALINNSCNKTKNALMLKLYFHTKFAIIWRSGDRAASWYILIIKPTRCTNFSNLFLEWNSTCFGQFLCPSSGVFHGTHSSGVCHTGFPTAQANLYDIYHCCVYSKKLLMMDRGIVRNM